MSTKRKISEKSSEIKYTPSEREARVIFAVSKLFEEPEIYKDKFKKIGEWDIMEASEIIELTKKIDLLKNNYEK